MQRSYHEHVLCQHHMNINLIKSGMATATVCLLWTFVGFERTVGDHEMGVSWEPFLKHRPSMQLLFENPAQNGLELAPLEELPPAGQTAFIEFCDIRFAEADTAKCLERFVATPRIARKPL